MTDSEYEEACHRAQDEAWAKCEAKRKELLDNFEPSKHVVISRAYRKMIVAYDAKEWMPSPEARG